MKTMVKKILIKGKIKLLTGIHIGGSNTALQIGGLDNSIIRNPMITSPLYQEVPLKEK